MPELYELYADKFELISKERFLITNNSLGEVNRLTDYLQKFPSGTLLVAFGAGQVIDVTKHVATKLQMNYLSVPTALSNDGIYSPVAVLSDGPKKMRVGADIPLGILIDTSIVKKAPPQTLLSGIGDLISNHNALADWELARDRNQELINDFAYTLSLFSAQRVTTLSPEHFGQYDFITAVAYSLVTSGLAMEIAGTSRPCSGAEHSISHAIDELFPDRSTFHGLQVAAATVPMLTLHGRQTRQIADFMKQLQMPIGLHQLGFGDDEIIEILTCARNMRNRFTILNTIKIDKDLLARIKTQ